MAKTKIPRKKIASLAALGIGVFVLIQVIMPEVVFRFWEWTSYQGDTLLVDPTGAPGSVLGVSVQDVGGFPTFISSNSDENPPYTQFQVAIPSIKLPPTKVTVNSNDADHSLTQLPGTALPGERGNVFVSGHSSLPQFYSPTNFQAIFSYLPNVKKGDQVYITAAGQQFTYQIIGMKIVDPKDVGVINPPDQIGRYLTLMTCVPPGFNTKRLIVLAKLKEE